MFILVSSPIKFYLQIGARYSFKQAINRRKSSSCSKSKLRSTEIRDAFVSYFVRNDHVYVKSSPVLPYNDPSLHFVNAGMNQFKPVLLGNISSPYRRVVNSQKCIRVGGKHNDLNDVGRDGYHHTFFEMLGNWSFGDYFKAEACQLAWELLTKEYGIPSSKLFVSFFEGDETIGLPPDEECFEIWRSLGVLPSHILPFGVRENFWEMGLTGPCGPCTEIHFDRSGNPASARQLVNAGSEEVIEIWNLVFMQYNKLASGDLVRLPAQHVDTGMGLERITAVLSGVKSNYDTDLFQPLLRAISQRSKTTYGGQLDDDMDVNYRILADHARMITVALADGMFPDSSHRLRKVLRSALSISRHQFQQRSQLLIDLAHIVSEILGNVYPEIPRNLPNIARIIQFEEDLFFDLQSKSSTEWNQITQKYPALSVLDCQETPGLVSAVKDIEGLLSPKMAKNANLGGDLAFKLYDTYGLSETVVENLAQCLHLNFDVSSFRLVLQNAQMQSKLHTSRNLPGRKANWLDSLVSNDVAPTNSDLKYVYSQENGNYSFPTVQTKIFGLVRDNELVQKVSEGESVIVICDKTNFYCEAGGQCSDTGILRTSTGEIIITHVQSLENYVLHVGKVFSGFVSSTESEAELEIDKTRRLAATANHTATHLLNSALREVFGVAPQRSSAITDQYLRFDCALFRHKYSEDDFKRVEDIVRTAIHACLPVEKQTLHLNQINQENVCLLPGETYPDLVNLIRIKGVVNSEELCCGTHVVNTGDIQAFAIISIKSAGVGVKSIKAVTRERANLAIKKGKDLLKVANNLEKDIRNVVRESEVERKLVKLSELDKSIKGLRDLKEDIPCVVTCELNRCLSTLESLLRSSVQEMLQEEVDAQMESALQTALTLKEGFLVTILDLPSKVRLSGAKLSLQKAARSVQEMPVFILASQEGSLTAKAVLPQNAILTGLTAEKWISSLKGIVQGKSGAPRGQDPALVCNFKSVRVSDDKMPEVLARAHRSAQKMARVFIKT